MRYVLTGHEAYRFHSTAVINHGRLRYRLPMNILGVICISEALLKLEPINAWKWVTGSS